MGRRRPPTPAGSPGAYWTGVCSYCGRHSYSTRALARRAARALFPGKSLRAYPCGGYWHFGPKPARLKRGLRSLGPSAPKEIRS